MNEDTQRLILLPFKVGYSVFRRNFFVAREVIYSSSSD